MVYVRKLQVGPGVESIDSRSSRRVNNAARAHTRKRRRLSVARTGGAGFPESAPGHLLDERAPLLPRDKGQWSPSRLGEAPRHKHGT